jgi:hypothetical protein
MMNEFQPKVKSKVLFEDIDDLTGSEMRDALWGVWDSQ